MTRQQNPRDDVGDLLRDFYAAYGTPAEGPPAGLDVGALVPANLVPPEDIKLLRKTLHDQHLLQEFRRCRDILEDLANRLPTEELLREVSQLPEATQQQFADLSHGVFWFSLAGSIGRPGDPANPIDQDRISLPPVLKAKLTVEGGLVLRLYVALVYIREGVLRDRIALAARAGGPCSKQVQRLIQCDYVRRIRNGLAHGSFSSCIAGLAFPDLRDKHKILVATPGFLNWLCTWLMLIQLQTLAATSNQGAQPGAPRRT